MYYYYNFILNHHWIKLLSKDLKTELYLLTVKIHGFLIQFD